MPKGVDWVNFIYVNLGFVAQIFIIYVHLLLHAADVLILLLDESQLYSNCTFCSCVHGAPNGYPFSLLF